MDCPVSAAQPEPLLSAAQKLEIMGPLAGGLAHDFNNLLTVILGGCELMAAREARAAGTPKDGLVQMVKAAADRGAAMTQQLLAFSRRQVLVPTVLDLDDLILGAFDSLRRLMPEDIAIETSLDSDTGCVRVDGGKMERVLMNLAANARDAMPSGGTLSFQTRRAEIGQARPGMPEPVPPGTYVHLRVADTGCGMTAAIRARAFEPLFTTKDAGKGIGLGLATVYGIVKQMGGFIQVESEPGRGSTFHLWFPIAAAASEAPAPVDLALALALAPRPPRRRDANPTILLVEDQDAVRAVAGHSLSAGQFTVLQARNGDEALRISQRWPQAIHLMVTDVVMPGMNGRQLADRMALERPEMRLLFMSGYTDDIVLSHAVDSTAVPFLQKPFTSSGLVSKVRDLLAS
jgi:two-component system cell cycle sensor histidine kinase/response regulator CckA